MTAPTIPIDIEQYPDTWEEFIGQDMAKRQLKVAVESSKRRNAPLGHVLLASGEPGIGKTALALLTTLELGTFVKIVSGKMSVNEARIALSSLDDRDVLLLEEIHRLVDGGKQNAEWLLHLLQDGVIMGPRGAEVQPAITVIGTTTDAGKLPETITSRFPLRPVLEPYTEDEAFSIATNMARYLLPGDVPFPSVENFELIAAAANRNPRTMRAIVSNLRDLAVVSLDEVYDGEHYNLTEALSWMGLTHDGLTEGACRYLTVLVEDFGGQAGERALKDRLREAGIEHIERVLIEKGLVVKTAQGRVPTKEGIARANELRSAP